MSRHDPHVLFVSYEFGTQVSGGVARVINGLCDALGGHLQFDIFLLQWRLDIHDFSGDLFRSGQLQQIFYSHYLSTILQLVREHRYDIVHILHCGEHTYQIVKNIREAGLLVRIVYSSHSIAKYEQHIRNNAEKDLVYENYLLKNCDHIHVLSAVAKDWLLLAYPELANANFHIIPNAIHSPRRTAKRQPAVPTVLCLSRWSHGKGIEYLLDAVPHITALVPAVQFLIAGRKENSWENEVHNYVQMIDDKVKAIGNCVEIFGWIDDQQKEALFERASLAVIPSELEYFPYALLEPAAARIPVVCSRIPGNQVILREDIDCLMYPTTDSHLLAQNIVTLLTNNDAANALAEEAYRRVSHDFTWERVSRMYLILYRDITAVNLNQEVGC